MNDANAKMIFSKDELNKLFTEGQGLRDFLSRIVKSIKLHMDADVCSIYLYNEKRKILILQATDGLSEDRVGELSLVEGEGITGLAFKKQRSIRGGCDDPQFKYVPGVDEKSLKSFLAVPIIVGNQRIGVLLLQDKKVSYFTQTDAKALESIASQLAATIENAQLLIGLPEIHRGEDSNEISHRLIHCAPIVEGMALGEIYRMEGPGFSDILISAYDFAYADTMEDFNNAISNTERQLETLQASLEKELSDVASLIFSAHLLMLRDEGFSGSMRQLIAKGSSPKDAVVKIANEYIKIFYDSDNPRMREKILDIKDLGHRILRNLISDAPDDGDYSGQIVLTSELLPSELLKLVTQKVEGIVLFGSGSASHITVLAHSLRVPLVSTDDMSLFHLPANTKLAIDGFQGWLFIQPDEKTQKNIQRVKDSAEQLEELETYVKSETHTVDGVRVSLRATVNLLSDLKIARRLKAEGIGLYRSEFPFIIRNDFPSEEEQYRIYKKIVDALDNPLVTLRTLDVGGDKILSYVSDSEEPNPFLGLRGIRFLLENRKVFVGQLKAMIRAGGKDRSIRILFPLISSVDDFKRAKSFVVKSLGYLERDGLGTFPMPKVGAMIELPSSVVLAEELAQESDFLSIGTNDLIQYMLGVDRTNEKVANLFDMRHPAVLRSIKQIAMAAKQADCPLSVCGIMSRDPKSVYYMIGLGIREFSLDSSKIPGMQDAVSRMSVQDAEKKASKISELLTSEEVRGYFDAMSAGNLSP